MKFYAVFMFEPNFRLLYTPYEEFVTDTFHSFIVIGM